MIDLMPRFQQIPGNQSTLPSIDGVSDQVASKLTNSNDVNQDNATVANGAGGNDVKPNTYDLPKIVPKIRKGEGGTLRDLTFRSLCPDDLDEIKALHDDWFPVKYKETFFLGAVQEKFLRSELPLFTEVATESDVSVIINQNDKSDGAATDPKPYNPKDHIVGALIGQIMEWSYCDDNEIVDDTSKYPKVAYIMTLGTTTNWRRKGLASALIKRAVETAATDKQCGAIYLHVITYNTAAINFYRKMGFEELRVMRGYYLIDGVYYDSYLYVRYLNGATKFGGSWILRLSRSFAELASYLSRKINNLLWVEEPPRKFSPHCKENGSEDIV